MKFFTCNTILDQSCLHVMGHDDNVLTVRIAFLAQCGAFSYRVVKGGLCSTVRDLGVSCQLWDNCAYSLASWTPPCTIVTHLIEGLCSFLGTWKYLEMLNPFYNRCFARCWSQFARWHSFSWWIEHENRLLGRGGEDGSVLQSQIGDNPQQIASTGWQAFWGLLCFFWVWGPSGFNQSLIL